MMLRTGKFLNSATFDHIIPLSKFGRDDETNVKLAHKLCNMLRGNDDA